MDKTETMKRYEAETGKSARDELYSGSMKLYMPTNDYIAWLEAKAEAYDKLSTWHDDLPKNDGRYICVIGDGGYPVIFAKKFKNGKWLLGEKEKIKWAYLPDGWEEV